jgi:hypothetical protein
MHQPQGLPEQTCSFSVNALTTFNRVRRAGVLARRASGHNINSSDAIG